MSVAWHRLLRRVDELDTDRLLADWRWLVSPDYQPFCMTLFGDWFFLGPDQAVHMLDLISGELREVGSTRADFLAALEDKATREDWLMDELAELCLERGLVPGPQECLALKIPPRIGGAIAFSNLQVLDLLVYQSIMGQLHRQTKAMPEGARITRFLVDGEEP